MSEQRGSNGLEEGRFVKADNGGDDETLEERMGVKKEVKPSP
jgi:hypothetical protein